MIALILLAAPVRAETVTVAALGDSLTQGYGLPQEEGFVPVMEAWLRERGADVEIVNAGVSGDTTAGGLSRVGWTLTEEVDALIVNLGGNDLLRGIDPEVSRENLSGILDAAAEAGVDTLLVGMQATGNFGQDYKAAFDAMYRELAQDYGTMLYPSYFAALSEEEGSARMAPGTMQADGIHPNAEGVRRIVEAMGPTVLDFVEGVE